MTARRLLTAVLLAGLVTTVTAADWPQWRGPNRDGVSKDTGLLKEWPKDGPPLAWQVNDLGAGYGSPAIVGGRVYLTANKGADDEFVLALDAKDGKPVWTARLGKVGPNQGPQYPAARSTPTVDGAVLYALGSDGDLACVETAGGTVRWRKSLRKDFGGKPGMWAYSESPLVDGDAVVVTPGGEKATIVALNKATGDVLWQSPVPSEVKGGEYAAYSSAVVAEAAGVKQYVQFLGTGVVGVDAKTGKFLWRYGATGKGPANMMTPVVKDGMVYTANGRMVSGGALVRLKADGDKVAAEQVYLEKGLPFSIGGSVLVNGHLYGTTNEGLVCGEFATGLVKWRGKGGPGSVLYADGCIYVHGENNQVALVEATPEAYREKGRFTPPGAPKHTVRGEVSWAYPSLADGRLYIRDVGTLWCYDVRAK